MSVRFRIHSPLIIIAVLFCCFSAPAQQIPPPAHPTTGYERLQFWRFSRVSLYMNDFGELTRYRAANAALNPPPTGENRVVFFGDSITDSWKLDDYFPGKPYLNRGISGQTTSQMLVRFRQDVIDPQPKAVLILAGTNDIAGNTGPVSLEDIEANYTTLAELARLHNIRLIYASVLPVHEYTERAGDMYTQRPPEKIVVLNRWLKDYCGAHDCLYLDYFSAMVDEQGHLKKELADDGLHPNPSGYKVMAPLAEAAIEKTLAQKP
jgi:lysophospholipase L1-like esterase